MLGYGMGTMCMNGARTVVSVWVWNGDLGDWNGDNHGMEQGGSAGGVDEKGWGHPVIRTGTL